MIGPDGRCRCCFFVDVVRNWAFLAGKVAVVAWVAVFTDTMVKIKITIKKRLKICTLVLKFCIVEF